MTIVLAFFGLLWPSVSYSFDKPIGAALGSQIKITDNPPTLINRQLGHYEAKITLTNESNKNLYGPFSLQVRELGSAELLDSDKKNGELGPWFKINPPGNRLDPAASHTVSVKFSNPSRAKLKPRYLVYGLTAEENEIPVAEAGNDQHIDVDEHPVAVKLDGSSSTDAESDSLDFRWKLIRRPDGSKAKLSSERLKKVYFTIDVPGLYIAQLTVNDHIANSEPDTIDIIGQTWLTKIFGSLGTIPDWLIAVVTLGSVLLSGWAIIKVNHFGETELRLSHRLEFKKMLLDLDKILINEPELFAIFDKDPQRSMRDKTLKASAKRKGLYFYLYNIFDVAFHYYYCFEDVYDKNKGDLKFKEKIVSYLERRNTDNSVQERKNDLKAGRLISKEREDKEVITAWIYEVLINSSGMRKFFREEKSVKNIYPKSFVDFINISIEEIEDYEQTS